MTIDSGEHSWRPLGSRSRLRLNKSVLFVLLVVTLGLVHLNNQGLLPVVFPTLYPHGQEKYTPPPSPMETRLSQSLEGYRTEVLEMLTMLSDQTKHSLKAESDGSELVKEQLMAVMALLGQQQQDHEEKHQQISKLAQEQLKQQQDLQLELQKYLQQQQLQQLQLQLLQQPVIVQSPGVATLEESIRNPKRIRIFDMVIMNDELDALEIRLQELYDVVDYFFVSESVETFTKLPKPLYYKENEYRFRQFRDKIIHIVVPVMSEQEEALYDKLSGMWAKESYMRNKGFLLSTDVVQPNDGDWILLSDLDEVPKRSFLQQVRNPDTNTEIGQRLTEGHDKSDGDVIRLVCGFYYYSFEFRHQYSWNGPVMVRYRDKDSSIYQQTGNTSDGKKKYPLLEKALYIAEDNWARAGQSMRDLRNADDVPRHDNQCFHCSWCFSHMHQFIRKIESYSHKEHDRPQFKDPEWIKDHVRSGVDIFERSYDKFSYVENNQDIPEFIKANPDRFSFMLNRKGQPNAGFLDPPVTSSLPASD